MTIYAESPEVEAIGRDLIKTYHGHLVNTRVDFCFVAQVDEEGNTQPMMKKGKEHWGDARKITGINAHLAGAADPFFCIEISQHTWEGLEPIQQRALIDHELSHLGIEDDKLTLLPHDIEEFGPIVARYGLWRKDVKNFAEIVQQLQLDFTSETKDEADATTVTISQGERSMTVNGQQLERVTRNAGRRARRRDRVQPEAA